MHETNFEWDFLHKQLQDLMKQELHMLREVLSSMKQEEEAILQGITVSRKALSSQRAPLNKRLKQLQKERSSITKALVQTLSEEIYIHHFNSKNFNLLISRDEDNAVETFNLRDQILHLMKTIKQQRDRLSKLSYHGENQTMPGQLQINSFPTKPLQALQTEENPNQ